MFTRNYPLLGMLFYCGFVASAAAEPLSLGQVWRLAEKNNPVLRAAQTVVQGAVAAQESAGAFPNPEVELGSGNSQFSPATTPDGRNHLLAISQLVELPGVRKARREVADAYLASRSGALEETRITLLAQVKVGFFEIQRCQEEARLAEQEHFLLGQIRSRVKSRVEVGEAARYELVKADAELRVAESAMQSAEIKIQQAKNRLRLLLGSALSEPFEIATAPLSSAELPPIETLRQALLAHQPSLASAMAETRRASAALAHERALHLPQPTLKWSAEQHPDVSLWRVGVSLPLPLWNRRTGPEGEALAQWAQMQANEEKVRLGLLSELELALGRYQIAQRRLHIFESGLLQDAETALRVAEAAYRYGERGILDYLDAQRVLRTTRLDFLNARYELYGTLIDIERLCVLSLAGETL